MKKIVIIGTLHAGWTPAKELVATLDELRPDQVLVELSPEELERARKNSIRDEMFVAYDWATANNVRVSVFDVENDTLKKGVTGKEQEFEELEKKCHDLLKSYSWKDLNTEGPWKNPEVAQLERRIEEKYFDKEKSKQREFEMLKNIKTQLVSGKNVILTGVGHLTFFKECLPEAKLLFRN